MTTFDFRLVKATYHNRIEYEDGPGSLQNIVSDEYTRVINSWENRGEEFEAVVVENGGWLKPDEDDGGRTEYGYTLERRPAGDTGEWEYVSSVRPKIYECERCGHPIGYYGCPCGPRY